MWRLAVAACIDNDGDGAIDMADTWCSPTWPYWESPPSGLGAELVLVVLPLGWLRTRKRAPSAQRP